MSDDDLKSAFHLGEMKADIIAIKETCARMESSIIRFGERTGALEGEINGIKVDMAAHKERDNKIADDVLDLKQGRKWFVTTIVGLFIAQVWGWIIGRR